MWVFLARRARERPGWVIHGPSHVIREAPTTRVAHAIRVAHATRVAYATREASLIEEE